MQVPVRSANSLSSQRRLASRETQHLPPIMPPGFRVSRCSPGMTEPLSAPHLHCDGLLALLSVHNLPLLTEITSGAWSLYDSHCPASPTHTDTGLASHVCGTKQ